MKATPLKKPTPVNVVLRRKAEQHLRAERPSGESSIGQNLRSANAELRIYEAELEIQNEELRDSRAQIEDSQQKYFRHFDLAPVGPAQRFPVHLVDEDLMAQPEGLFEQRALARQYAGDHLDHVGPLR